MTTKVHVNPAFIKLEDFMKELPEIFDKEGKTLKNDRNEIKVIEHNEFKLCIKSFKRVTTFNLYMYSWFRSTKAKRSYKIAKKLQKYNINTPSPIGYVEVYDKWHILRKAFYVSLYLEYDFDMNDVLDSNISKQESILSSFAQYMAQAVHPAGMWHNDLSPGNVLINSRDKDNWTFSFIDLNRIKFKAFILPFRGLINLKKLTNQPLALTLMAEQYAISANRSPRIFSIFLIRRNLLFEVRRFYTKRVLHVFKSRK